MCVRNTQVFTGQRVSAEDVAAVVSSRTGHLGIVTRLQATAMYRTIVIVWAGDSCTLACVFISAI